MSRSRSLALPATFDEITAEWVAAALSERYPRTQIASLVVEDRMGGTAGKARLLLEYESGGDALPRRMIAKGGFEQNQWAALLASQYVREAIFYRDGAPDLAINIPACYFAGVDETAQQGVVLLEDLAERPVTFGRATRPVTPDVADQVLDMLARVHALWWQSPRLDRLEQFPGQLADAVFSIILEPAHWAACSQGPVAAATPPELLDRDRVEAALRASWALAPVGPSCLVHGDPHLGNLFFDADGTPGLLDWQFAMRGPWAHDVQWFMVGSLDVEDRRANERELLLSYLERLRAYGVPSPSFDDAWLSYRQNLVYGLCWMADPEELQPEDVNASNALRFARAVEDLDPFDALGL